MQRPAEYLLYGSAIAAGVVSEADHRCCDDGAYAVVVAGATDKCGVGGLVVATTRFLQASISVT